jgi:futalosine hydrolase
MRILLVAATASECRPLATAIGCSLDASSRIATCRHRTHIVDLLITGVGMVATAAWCARTLAQQHYDLALNIGVCGSFDPAIAPGTVVHVTADRIAELGAEDGDAFITVHDLRLLDPDEFPFSGGQLRNASPPPLAPLRSLSAVSAITVNTVHGSERSIAATFGRFQPQVESMEGAAFMYACLVAGVPFAQIRAVSNVVERRNRAAWKLEAAIARLTETAREVLQHA